MQDHTLTFSFPNPHQYTPPHYDPLLFCSGSELISSSSNSTPFVSAPSSPSRMKGFYFSAPTSPNWARRTLYHQQQQQQQQPYDYDHDHDNHDDHQYYNNDSMSGLLMMDPYNDEDNNDHESCSLLIDHEAMGGGGSCHDMLMLGGADDHEIITNGRSSFHMDEILMDHSLMSAKDADADLIVDTIDTSNASQYALQFETLVRELLES